MSLERGHSPHPGTTWVWRDADALWPLRTCSFCGSITPETMVELLQRELVTATGTQWKGGWPHKFYAEDDSGKRWKFYSEHLTLASDFGLIAGLLKDILGISFVYDSVGRLNFTAPSLGFVGTVLRGQTQINDPS